MNDIMIINTNDGQIAVRADLIAFFLRGNVSGAVDVQLINGETAQLGVVDVDTFKEIAMRWGRVLRDE